MNNQIGLFNLCLNESDIVYTQNKISKHIIDFLKPKGKILDPCKGDGSFFNVFPTTETNLYCEIEEGKDFYAFNEKVDWIIGNPPYSIFKDWLKHSFNIADNVSYLVPTNKIFQSWKVMDLINEYGGIKSIIVYGSGTLIGFPFGFSVGNFTFEKGYNGKTDIKLVNPKTI